MVMMRSRARLPAFVSHNQPSIAPNGGPPSPDAVRPTSKSVSSEMDGRHLQLEEEDREPTQTRV